MTDVLEKVITTGVLGGAPDGAREGLLAPQQADKFFDYAFEETVLLNGYARIQKMESDVVDVDSMRVGTRLLRGASEAVDDGVNVGVAWRRVSLSAVKLRLDFELSRESLEDGKRGDALEDDVARLISAQIGTDLEDLAINGDTTVKDPLIGQLDGWERYGHKSGHVVDAGGAGASQDVFHKALKAMPQKYRRRQELKFFTGGNVVQDYVYNLQGKDANGNLNPEGVRNGNFDNFNRARPFGTEIVEVPLMNDQKKGDYSGAGAAEHSDIWLTYPKNLVWGVRRNVEIFRNFVAKKDAIEYTVFTRVAANIESGDCFVVVKNVKNSL